MSSLRLGNLLGGSWAVISRVISPRIWVISMVTLLITLLITTHEPPSSLLAVRAKAALDLEPSSFGAGDRRAKSEVVRRIFGEVS